LLGQLRRRGDCLYATSIARQIKHDYPNCHLTWAVSSMCCSVVRNNPYVDTVWEVAPPADNDPIKEWEMFEKAANQKKNAGEFDEIFLTQVYPGNYKNYDGTVRSSLFRGYPNPITVPVTPVVRLNDFEVNNVNRFIARHNISQKDTVILFECASASAQSALTPEFALKAAAAVFRKRNSIKFILSSAEKINTSEPYIIDGSTLDYLENAELTKYCSFLVGCSSGISWLSTADWAKPLPKVQLLSKHTRMYASMLCDAEYFRLPTDHIIELFDLSPQKTAEVILYILDNSFGEAKRKYQKNIPIKFDFYLSQIYHELLSKKKFIHAAQALQIAKERFHDINKAEAELTTSISQILTPYIQYFWQKMNEGEKTAFTPFCIVPTMNQQLLISIKSILQLSYRSIVGQFKKTARPMLLEILYNWK
jgi:hypothetical protein